MQLIYEIADQSQPYKGLYLDTEDRSVFAHDAGMTLIDWADGQGEQSSDIDRLVLRDDAGHRGTNPDEDAQSWLTSWSQSGWDRFDSAYRHAKSRAESLGIELLVQPSSQGMLSDAVSTLNWCARGAGQDACLLLDPVGWVVPSMMRDLDDHLERINELCIEMIEQGRVGVVLLRSVDRAPLLHEEGTAAMIVSGLSGLIKRADTIAVLDERDLAVIGRSTNPNP